MTDLHSHYDNSSTADNDVSINNQIDNNSNTNINTVPSHRLIYTSVSLHITTTNHILVLLYRSVHTLVMGYSHNKQIYLYIEECTWLVEAGWMEVIDSNDKHIYSVYELYSIISNMIHQHNSTQQLQHNDITHISKTLQLPLHLDQRLYTPLASYNTYSVLRNSGNPVMRYQLYKYLTEPYNYSNTNNNDNTLPLDVYCVWHSYRASSFTKSRPTQPDYIAIVIDDGSNNTGLQQYSLVDLYNYGLTLLHNIPFQLSIVNSVGKVVFIDLSSQPIISATNTKQITKPD